MIQLEVGNTIQSKAKNYNVTEGDVARLNLLRGACAIAARRRSTLLYGELAPLVGLAPNGLGRLLDLLSEDCIRRGEPSLAALVVNQETGLPGSGFEGDDAAEREACFAFWGG